MGRHNTSSNSACRVPHVALFYPGGLTFRNRGLRSFSSPFSDFYFLISSVFLLHRSQKSLTVDGACPAYNAAFRIMPSCVTSSAPFPLD